MRNAWYGTEPPATEASAFGAPIVNMPVGDVNEYPSACGRFALEQTLKPIPPSPRPVGSVQNPAEHTPLAQSVPTLHVGAV